MGEKVFTLRMDEELFEKVRNIADKNKRSIAKEIEFQLEQYQLIADGLIPPAFKNIMDDYMRRVEEHDKQVQKLYQQICKHDELLEIAKERFGTTNLTDI